MPKKTTRNQQIAIKPIPWEPGWLVVRGARQNNLKSIDVPFPLAAFTVVTGVSGSGKSSLVEDVLYKSLARTLHRAQGTPGTYDSIEGVELINKVIRVDQQPLGQTPTSNPATYTGAFELIRDLFAQLPESKLRGYSPRRFSFNVPGGRCEKCEGNGQLKIEMHFLPDVWITCDACEGKRYDRQTLDVKFHGYSISDILEMSCGDALQLFANIPGVRRILQTLCDVGLDYLALGQAAPTLSGGEAQRVKLASELSRVDTGRTLYLLDEPTTGLHFEDLTKLLGVVQRLVDLGNTVIMVEHNLDMIKSADWIIDLGPEAGLDGGHLVFAGTPEKLVERLDLHSYTALALAPILKKGKYENRVPYSPNTERVSPHDEKGQDSVVGAGMESVPRLKTGTIGDLATMVGEETLLEGTRMPWELNGRIWHTKERLSRGGLPCRWDGQILTDIVDRIQETDCFSETDWNNRSLVEICGEKKSYGWFFHALTNEEWLLRLKFRTAKNMFRRDHLVQRLNLRPLNEMDDIPLYGTEPRVRVQQAGGAWQEIELKVHSYSEIDRDEFWEFLDEAITGFGRVTQKVRSKPEDLMPWKVLKEKWHFLPKGLTGGSQLKWDYTLLKGVFALLDELVPTARIVWTNKVLVPYYLQPEIKAGGRVLPWTIVGTKRCEAITLDVYVRKNSIPLGKIRNIGVEPFVNGENPYYDILELRFQKKGDFDRTTVGAILKESLAQNVVQR